MAWRLAKSLERLRREINAMAPNRNKSHDGTIGDAAHASRKSDHNPWVDDGVVTAIDITHDPQNGVDCNKIVKALKDSKDPRQKYIIWNSQIWNPSVSPDWRPYGGSNPHTQHFHLSVVPQRALYDSEKDWTAIVDVSFAPVPNAPPPPPVYRRGYVGPEVGLIWQLLSADEKSFGPVLEAAVRAYQNKHGLAVDGVVGPITMRSLKQETTS